MSRPEERVVHVQPVEPVTFGHWPFRHHTTVVMATYDSGRVAVIQLGEGINLELASVGPLDKAEATA